MIIYTVGLHGQINWTDLIFKHWSYIYIVGLHGQINWTELIIKQWSYINCRYLYGLTERTDDWAIIIYKVDLHGQQGRTKPLTQGGIIAPPPLKIEQKAVFLICSQTPVLPFSICKLQFTHFLSVNSCSPTFYL